MSRHRAATRPRRIVLVIHGDRADRPELREAVRDARDRGHEIRPRVTWEAGDAERFAREGAEAGVDTVVAVGGDGTVNEVLNGIASQVRERRPALGIVPLGTANDFAAQSGIPDDPAAALALVLERSPRWLDAGGLNGRRFLNVSTAGIGAETTAETSAEAKDVLGKLAYAITGMRKFVELEPRRARFTAPGLDEELEFLLFAVGNARVTGGGMCLTPRARTRDGLLDVCVIPTSTRTELVLRALRLRTGDHLSDPGVLYLQVPWLRVASAEPLRVNLDGEPSDASRLAYEALAREVRVHLAHLPEDVDASAGDAATPASIDVASG